MPRLGLRLSTRDLPGGEVAAADVEHLPLAHELYHRLPDFFPRRLTIPVMHLVEVDVVGLQSSQAAFTRLADVIGRQTPLIGTFAHLSIDLCGEDNPLPPASSLSQPAPDDLFRQALARF